MKGVKGEVGRSDTRDVSRDRFIQNLKGEDKDLSVMWKGREVEINKPVRRERDMILMAGFWIDWRGEG